MRNLSYNYKKTLLTYKLHWIQLLFRHGFSYFLNSSSSSFIHFKKTVHELKEPFISHSSRPVSPRYRRNYTSTLLIGTVTVCNRWFRCTPEIKEKLCRLIIDIHKDINYCNYLHSINRAVTSNLQGC